MRKVQSNFGWLTVGEVLTMNEAEGWHGAWRGLCLDCTVEVDIGLATVTMWDVGDL
jgi:hypothetical protein